MTITDKPEENQTEDTPREHDELIEPLRAPTVNTEADKKKLFKTQLEKGFENNYNLFIENPAYFTTVMGDVIILKTCTMCKAPNILHITNPGEVCKLPMFPSTSNSAITQYLDKIQNFTAIKAIAVYYDLAVQKTSKTQETQSVNITNEKRSKIPAYVKENHSYWEKMVKAWDETYPNVRPLDKYLELLEALSKGGGDDLSTKLQSEGLNYLQNDIITKCLKKLAAYLDRTVMTKTEEINKRWNDLFRPSDQPTSDFMAKFDLIEVQQKEAGLILNTKQKAIQCFAKANLDANMRNIVIPQVDLDSAHALQQMRTAILNVTPTPGATSNFYSQRGRTMNRDNRGRSRSFSQSYMYKRRCPCSDCKKHDKDYNEGRSPSNDARQKYRNYSAARNDNNTGKKSDTIVSSIYLNLTGRQIVIDTGCVRSIMSKQDIPYLESLIGKQLKTTGESYGVRFGDNKTTQTEAVVLVPFWDGKNVTELPVGVVHDKIPFLLGLSYLRQLNGRIAVDDRLELKNGATFPMTGGVHGHQKIEWTRSLHCGPNKVRPDSSQSVSDSRSNFFESTVDTAFQDFFNDEEMVCFKADITVNARDRLLDDEGPKFMNHFSPLCRAGEYNDMDTDSVYLYRNNITEKLPVRNPFEYSELGKGIMKTSHDRGIRNGVDLEELFEELDQPERERGNLQVKFEATVSRITFDPLDCPTALISMENILLRDNEKTYYNKLTKKKLDLKMPDDEKLPKENDEEEILYSDLQWAPKPLPMDMCFFIRSSGHILNLKTSTTTEGSENMNFKTYIETKTGKKSSFSDENTPRFSEKLLYDGKSIDELESVPKLKEIHDYSQKQVHNAQKKRAPKKKAIRGNKKSSQSLKPNVEIPEIKAAMDVEIEKFKKYQVFEEVQDSPHIYKIPSSWVVTKKDSKKEGENKYKCRLVALGNLDRKINLKKTDSPTLSRESLRLVLSTIANHEFDLQGCDVSSAFLQGAPLDREVFMYPPKEYRTLGKVWLLRGGV